MHKNRVLQVVVAVALGAWIGALLGPRAAPLGAIAGVLVQILKTLAAPLLFFAVVDAFLQTDVKARGLLRLLGFGLLNAVVAALIAWGLSEVTAHWIKPQDLARSWLAGTPGIGRTPRLAELLSGLIPASMLKPLVDNQVLPIILLSVFLGWGLVSLRRSGEAAPTLEKFFHEGFVLMTRLLKPVLALIPLAAFGAVAQSVGNSGFEIFATLGRFVVIVTVGLALHAVVYYSLLLKFWARVSPVKFFADSSEALASAFAAGSSLAALPVTLRTLEQKRKIPRDSARLAACVGTNLNHDGILLYEVSAALFVAQLVGMTLTVGQKGQVALTALLAAVGIAGIPDAGLVTLSLVLGAVGLPLQAVSFLLPVDWFLGRLRATTNVCSDLTVAHLLAAKRR